MDPSCIAERPPMIQMFGNLLGHAIRDILSIRGAEGEGGIDLLFVAAGDHVDLRVKMGSENGFESENELGLNEIHVFAIQRVFFSGELVQLSRENF